VHNNKQFIFVRPKGKPKNSMGDQILAFTNICKVFTYVNTLQILVKILILLLTIKLREFTMITISLYQIQCVNIDMIIMILRAS